MATVALACALGGCASRGFDTSEIEPAGFSVQHGAGVALRVYPADRENRAYADELAPQIKKELAQAGFDVDGESLGVEVCITHIAPGGAWGEEAECHLKVSITQGRANWSFEVIGYSGSTWGRDRIPSALTEAARGVASRLSSALK